MLDVLIIGGGVCGCSLLYALSRFRVKTMLLEQENDIGVGTTKANSAIVHAGYDPEPGTLMARYNVRGNALIEQLCGDLHIGYRKTGSLVVGFSEGERAELERLYKRGLQNGVPGLRILEKDELHALEPNLSDNALFALYAPTAAIVDPWGLAQTQAIAAMEAGAQIRTSCGVTAMRREKGGFVVQTVQGEFSARFVVNAAGVDCADVAGMLETPRFSIHPNRGQYFLLDTTQGAQVNHVVFQCPTAQGKGVLVAPTVHGNLIVGPSAEPAPPGNVDTTAEGLAGVREAAARSVPTINFRETIRNFAGLRAMADGGDFIVEQSAQTPGFFHIAGIKSPGLTAAPAIALDILSMLESAGLLLSPNPDFQPKSHRIHFKDLSAKDKAATIRKNPMYGKILCRCQTVTEGELVDALRGPLPPRSLGAVKRRINPGMGRCQGGFCGPRVQAIIARELGVSQCEVPMDAAGTTIVIGETKTPPKGGC